MRMYQYDKHLDFHALGREIKRKREEKGWTQEYLACRATIQIGQRGKGREKKVEGQSLHRV